MRKEDEKYRNYLQILQEELIPAMGCTEPIAIAYAAAKAKELLGEIPTSVIIEASGSTEYWRPEGNRGCSSGRYCCRSSGTESGSDFRNYTGGAGED